MRRTWEPCQENLWLCLNMPAILTWLADGWKLLTGAKEKDWLWTGGWCVMLPFRKKKKHAFLLHKPLSFLNQTQNKGRSSYGTKTTLTPVKDMWRLIMRTKWAMLEIKIGTTKLTKWCAEPLTVDGQWESPTCTGPSAVQSGWMNWNAKGTKKVCGTVTVGLVQRSAFTESPRWKESHVHVSLWSFTLHVFMNNITKGSPINLFLFFFRWNQLRTGTTSVWRSGQVQDPVSWRESNWLHLQWWVW